MKYLIYRLISPSGKSYVGQTKQPLAVIRFKQHIQGWRRWIKDERPLKSYNRKLFCAFDKYDPSTWTAENISEINTESHSVVDDAEIKAIIDFNAVKGGYNVQLGGFGGRGSVRSEGHKTKQSESRKAYWLTPEGIAWKQQLSERMKKNNPGGESLKGKPAWNRGLHHTEETKLKISKGGKLAWGKVDTLTRAGFAARAVQMGKNNLGRHHTDETKRKVAEANMGREQSARQKQRAKETHQKRYLITSPDGTIQEIVNLHQFCRDNNLRDSNITRSGSRGWKAVLA